MVTSFSIGVIALAMCVVGVLVLSGGGLAAYVMIRGRRKKAQGFEVLPVQNVRNESGEGTVEKRSW